MVQRERELTEAAAGQVAAAPYKTTLLERCAVAEAACDLAIGGADNAAALADEVCATIAATPDQGTVAGRALWNLLWLAAELTTAVDLYRAETLLTEVARLFERRFVRTLTGERHTESPDELDAAEMAFDFFFNRADQPLLLLRLDRCLATLERVARLSNRHCQHAAVHGLGHLRQQVSGHAKTHLVESAIEDVAQRTTDERLREFAAAAKRGAIA